MKYQQKSFSTIGKGDDIKLRSGVTDEQAKANEEALKEESKRINEALRKDKAEASKGAKKVVPYGNRLLVRRRKIGEKIGSLIIAPTATAERPTDLADVVYVPDHTFADKELLENAEKIISSFKAKMLEGDSDAFKSLLDFHAYLRVKSIQVGMTVMISKYIGTDFHDNEGSGTLTLVDAADVIGIIKQC